MCVHQSISLQSLNYVPISLVSTNSFDSATLRFSAACIVITHGEPNNETNDEKTRKHSWAFGPCISDISLCSERGFSEQPCCTVSQN